MAISNILRLQPNPHLIMKPLPLLLALSIATRLSAQEKFIEVTVSDTVLAEAKTFVYRLEMPTRDIYNDEVHAKDPSAYRQVIAQREKKRQQSFDSLLLSIKQKGFTVLPLTAQDTFMVISLEMPTFSRRILVHTVDSLSQIYQLIRNDSRITASVSTSVAPDESDYQKALSKKLISEATEKAENIAALTHHHLGGVISVTSKPEEPGGGWTSYPPLSALGDAMTPGWQTTLKSSQLEVLAATLSVNTLYPIKATFIVRFAVE
jgi:hypothetical protein